MKAEKAKKLAKRIWTGLCLVILCVNFITLVLSALDLREQSGWLPFGVLAVESGSMEPAISKGDLLLIQEVPFADLQIGDSVTFHNASGFVTHRVVGQKAGRYITQGLANTMADPTPMGADSYCGKVVAVVPMLGWPVQVLSDSPAAVVLLCLLVFMLCVGQPVLEEVYYRRTQGKKSRYTSGRAILSRILSCSAVISLLVAMPALTEAKYLTQLKRYETLLARPMYFSSNYLSDGNGNHYSIQGWTGGDYPLNLQIRNYDNSLLYNTAGIDLNYGIWLEMDSNSSANYTVTLTASATGITELTEENFDFPENWPADRKAYRIPGNNDGGVDHSISILVEPKEENYIPNEGEMVKFEIYASTFDNENYTRELKGSFQFNATKEQNFLGQRNVDDNGSMVTLTLTTNLVNDGGTAAPERLVCFAWNPDLWYLNEYQRTAVNAILDSSGKYERQSGRLYMRLQAFSKIELQFFKKSDVEPLAGHFVIEEVPSVNDQPTVTPFGPVNNQE